MAFYIVATPIGNLEDITMRALTVLKEVNCIFAEDTRVTKKLLARYDIATPVRAYHHHSKERVYQNVITLLSQGKDIALVTDAGTPGISDPGGMLIEKVYGHFGSTLAIHPIPGASALTAALSISGFPTDRFTFYGFLPHKKGRNKLLAEVAKNTKTSILFESPHRIVKTLTQLSELLPLGRQIVVTRELTKRFETVYRGTATDVLKEVKKDPQKGEFVIIIRG